MNGQKPRSRLILTIVTEEKIETILVPEAENVFFDIDAHYDEIMLRDKARLQPMGESFSLKFDPIPDERGVKYIVKVTEGEEMNDEKRCDRCGHTRSEHQRYVGEYVKTPCMMEECPCGDWTYNIMKEENLPSYSEAARAMARTRDRYEGFEHVQASLYGGEAVGFMDRLSESPLEKRRTELFKKADELVNGSREEIYGPPEINFQTIADLWTAMGFRIQSWDGDIRNINATDVALAMTQVKMGRLRTSPDHVDTWVDGIGYLGLGGEVATKGQDLPWNDKSEGSFSPVVIEYQHIAIPGQGDEHSVHYFWRCGDCYTYMEESNFAFHAWDTHRTRDWVQTEEIFNQIPKKPKEDRPIVFQKLPTRRFGRKMAGVRCGECQEDMPWASIQEHMDTKHPEFSNYFAPPNFPQK